MSGAPTFPANGYPVGLTGATAAARFAGATTSGAPTSGTFAAGDFTVDQTGNIYVCTVAGTPGTWVSIAVNYAAITSMRPSKVESTSFLVTSMNGTTTANTGWTLGQVFFVPLDIPATQTFTGLATSITVAAVGGTTPLVHLGLYADDGSGSRPTGSVLTNTEVTFDPTGATGDKYVAWGAAQSFAPGRVWAGWMLTSGSALGTLPTAVCLNPLQPIGLASLGNNSHRGWAMGTTSNASTLATVSGLFRQGGNFPMMGMKAQ